MKSRFVLVFLSLAILSGELCADGAAAEKPQQPPAQVVTYPAPSGEAAEGDYRVEVNDKPVDLYTAESEHFGKYYFGSFDFAGEVTVRVTSAQPLQQAAILPSRFGIKAVMDGPHGLTFTAARPFRVVIERDGRNGPLLLFGNPIETDRPKADDPNVVYFGPGVHRPETITLVDNQTLYVAGGAVVKGCVLAKGDNITVRGRGILDGSDYPHLKGPRMWMLGMMAGKNLLVRDVMLRGSWTWTLVVKACDGVVIDNVKICNSRVINDDGIDLVNSRNIVIRNCFIRTQDDCIAVKGMDHSTQKPCENMTIESCELWADRANIFRIGFECAAEAMRDLVARDLDVLHYGPYRKPEEFWSHAVFFLQPSNNMPIERMRFENIRVNANGEDIILVLARPMVCKSSKKMDTEAGRLSECLFKDLAVTGNADNFRGMIFVAGHDAEHTVERLTFENVTRFGKTVTADDPNVTLGNHAHDIRFEDR